MRSTLFVIACAALVGCGHQASSPEPEFAIVAGSLEYRATTLAGEPLVTGWLNIEVVDDSIIVGTWLADWAPGADTAFPVGAQVGSGTLAGKQSEGRVAIDLNPGHADNNVILVATTSETGIAGTWTWSGIAGPQSGGRFSALPDSVSR